MSDFGRHHDDDIRDRRERDRYRRDEGRGGFFGSGRGDGDRDERSRFGGGRLSEADRRSRGWEREESFGYDDYHQGLPIDETSRLIASNKVEGTPVYGRGGDRLGTIYNFMVDKRSGQVEYAVMRYGGFLGLGQRYYPLPWRILSFDTREGGYRIDMSHRDLERAPSFGRDDEPSFSRDYGRRVNNWYGLDY
jgi:PRC-barrel domain